MLKMVVDFKQLNQENQSFAGGKGSMLARMYQSGYPVPKGFIVLSEAFEYGKLKNEALNDIQCNLEKITKNNEESAFAVRSSALSEDSAQASFAGEFETVLNVKKEDVLQAIITVFQSRESERVKVYSRFQGMEDSHKIAVVVQGMVQSEISGVLFTADPITGDMTHMVGNYVHGFGESLVSGEANAHSFKIIKPKGKYDGPDGFIKYSKRLYKCALKLESEFKGPQDIEWAVASGELYILQARPITTLNIGNLDTYEINYSLCGDYLWSNSNVAEAMSDVATPLTWSILKAQDEEISVVPGYYLWGNICGRMYSNISQLSSAASVIGSNSGVEKMSDIFGNIPVEMSIPVYPFSKLGYIKEILPRVRSFLINTRKASKNMAEFLHNTPSWCKRTALSIRLARTENELLDLWKREIQLYSSRMLWVSVKGGQKMVAVVNKLSNELKKLTGTEDASVLLSNLRGNLEFASLGPVLGISNMVKGKMSVEEYLSKYGHRGPHELELSIPDTAEEEGLIEKQVEDFKKFNIDVEELLKKQRLQYEEAWKRLKSRFPSKVKSIEKRMKKAWEAARIREATRAEYVRVYRINRVFVRRAGELTGIGEDIFYLYIDEVLNLLSGDERALKNIAARKLNYGKYKELPIYPSIIRGRFNPFQWVKDPNRRVDYYDPSLAIVPNSSEELKGFAGATGRIEGNVRVLANPEEGENLLPGEILVTSTTNIGWTPIFPKVAAIITDIGAPLSHAAIVARELGIPAVVGCGNATTKLKTGDKVIVDGGKGTVQIFK
ncbi:PEP/pyruvate-binding domain-containing protein [Clostridium sp. WILCCON 0269]|uniref:PEP/pyruvate-binding domain-containing protein n=1 Tax=Candidatus Clostridium eludens TaxID=3381663 RepID=A0ABW8SP95_9CLOT